MHRDSAASIRLKMVLLAPEARKSLRVLLKENSLSLKWFEAFQRLSSVQEKDDQVKEVATEIMSTPIEFAEKEGKDLKVLGSLSRSEYYLNNNDRMNESEEQLDQEKEEEEDKYKIQQMYQDEAMRRRELEEAKNEFSRRLKIEKRNSITTKSTGTGLKGQTGMRKVGTGTFATSGNKTSVGNAGGTNAFITKSSSYVSTGSNLVGTITSASSLSSTKTSATSKNNNESTTNAYSVTSKSVPGKVDSPRTTARNVDSPKSVPSEKAPTHNSKEKISGSSATSTTTSSTTSNNKTTKVAKTK